MKKLDFRPKNKRVFKFDTICTDLVDLRKIRDIILCTPTEEVLLSECENVDWVSSIHEAKLSDLANACPELTNIYSSGEARSLE